MQNRLTPNFAFADMVPDHALGSRVWSTEGREYIDLAGGIAVNALGHCHPALVAALTAQAHKLWHVSNLYTTAAAQALAQRIGAAGFDDFLLINQGEQANGIALGRYGSREAAQRRQSALQAKGFQAQIQAVGAEGTAQWWLDVTAGEGAGAAQLKTLAAAAQSRSLDCAALR